MKNNKELCFVFNKENCIQCNGCEIACKSWNNLNQGLRFKKVFNIWEGIYPEIKSHSLSISCLHCVEPECIKVCPTDAIIKNLENGVVSVDEGICVGCKFCYDACPYNIPEFDNDGIMRKCQICGDKPACVLTCPTGAIQLKYVEISEKMEIEKTYLMELHCVGTV